MREFYYVTISHTECSFAITPAGEFSTSRLLLNITMASTATTAQTTSMHNKDDIIVDAVVAFKSREEPVQVNGSVCQISSLEVYRGREEAIEISHQEFSLSDNGTIQVCII